MEGLLENCLKLRPLGIPLSTYVKCSFVSELPYDLVCLVGPALVGTLRHAHASGISHQDIRRENILIVLPANQQTDCISFLRELGGVGKMLREVKLTECSFYLNDWGEAKFTTDSKKFKKDLEMLVNILLNIHIDEDYSPSRSSTPSRSSSASTREPIGASSGGDDSDAPTASQLGIQLASSLEYDLLSSFFRGLAKI